ncbi:hypothetical protein LZG04_37375 [Saccharothrix sp. S26]|uniref:hypothetical protein n=1 Tax=Saccharothrix sp. S26 TaxID=2907215 RepID=UPI001F488635|nr:hypothetical protein [Saccharothrix sp. S26]MCE7000450.1 hypothetical protein [Saccharothrix sp. S26]
MSRGAGLVGGTSAPVLEWESVRRWAGPAWRVGRVVLTVVLWVVALVIALSTDGLGVPLPVTLVVLATPVVLVARPRLGCAVAIGAAALLAAAGEPPTVVVPFAVHAAYCTYSLARLVIGAVRQRRVFAELAVPVTVTLPEGDPLVRHTPRLRLGLIWTMLITAAVLAVWAWLGEHPTLWAAAGVLGSVVVVQLARLTAARLAPRRLLGRPAPAVRVTVTFHPGSRLTVHTADRHRGQVASVPLDAIVLRPEDARAPDVLAASASIDLYAATPPAADLFPATVVGDFRAGGYVLVVTDHGVLLPGGPVRAEVGDEPIGIPPTLVDGRAWSGLRRPT